MVQFENHSPRRIKEYFYGIVYAIPMHGVYLPFFTPNSELLDFSSSTSYQDTKAVIKS